MTRRRWIADEWSGDRASLLGDHADHLVRVLRARVGQEFDIAAGGTVRLGTISAITPDRIDFTLGEEVTEAAALQIIVALSIFKFDRFEWAIEKLTELGVTLIVPLAARRTDAHLRKAAEKRVERWRRVALAASEQSRRASAPEIRDVAELHSVLSLPADARIVLDETASVDASFLSLLRNELHQDSIDRIALAFGPEGGWTEEELRLLRENGWKQASLGPRILRAETAAIAAVAITAAELGG